MALVSACGKLDLDMVNVVHSGVTRALIGGGGGGCILIYSCSARRISFEMKLKTIDFKRNSVGQNTNI